MNFPIETAAAFPSQTATALPKRPLGASSCRETCTTTTSDASAILATASGTEFLASDWSATTMVKQPRSPLGLLGPPPRTLQGMSASRRHQTWDPNAPGFGSGGRRSTGCLVDWLECDWEKDTRVIVCHSWKSRIVTRYRSGAAKTKVHD